MMRKWFVSMLVVSFLLIGFTEKNSVPVSAEVPTTKKLTASADRIYVLHRESRIVQILDSSLKEWKRFEIVTPYSRALPDPIDIACDEEILYVLDAEFNEIWCYALNGDYALNGEFVRSIPFVRQYLQEPSAICLAGENLLIADIGCIWEIDKMGHVLERIRTFPLLGGMPMQITDMTLDHGLLYVTDLTNSQVVLYEYPKKAQLSYAWDSLFIISGYGHEPGRYYAPSGVAAQGDRVYVCDSLKASVDWHHTRTGKVEILPQAEWENQHPTDVAIRDGKLWIVYRETDKPRVLPIEETPLITCNPDHLDFGSVPAPQSDVLYFHLYSENGLPFSGKIYSDNPYFTIREKIIREKTSFSIQVEMQSVEMNPNDTQTGLIHFVPDTGEPITVKVKGRTTGQKDLQLSVAGWMHDAMKEDLWFSVGIKRQNGLSGPIECSFGKTEIPFLLSWEDPVMTKPRDDYNAILLEPVTHFVEPGYYTIPVIVKCAEEKIIKTIQVPFIYRGWAGAVPGTILGEYFSADWCCYCPSALKALPELHQKYTTDEITFLAYYNDCLEEDPKRLCFPEAEARMKSYNTIGMHRIMLMNGTHKIDQAYNDGETTMTKEYDEYIQRISPMVSPVSLSGSAKWEEESRELIIGARVECLQDLDWKQPRLICVIAEHGIEFPAKNGLNIHHYVVRDFISLPNPEKNESYGTPLLDDEGEKLHREGDTWSGHLSVKLDEVVNPENAFCILIVQDLETMQLVQSRYVPLHTTGTETTKWLAERKDFILQPNGDTLVRAWFINQGDRVDTFEIEIFNRKPFMDGDLWTVDGNAYSIRQTVSVTLNPMEATSVEFSLPPDFGEPEPPSLLVKATRKGRPDAEANTLVLPMKRFEKHRFTLLYPDESILDSGKGFSIDRKTSLVVLKTDPWAMVLTDLEDYPEGIETDMAFYDGIVSFSLGKCYTLEEEKVKLTFPAEEGAEMISFYTKRLLVMKLTIGSTRMKINQAFTILEAAPFIMNSRTMVPLRIITENLLCSPKIEYDDETKRITITGPGNSISITTGVPTAFVNGRKVELDAPPVNRNGRVFLPIRFFAEELGAYVTWDSIKEEVTIKNSES